MAKRQKTGGRRKGTPNKVTAEIRDAAQQYTVEAQARLDALPERFADFIAAPERFVAQLVAEAA